MAESEIPFTNMYVYVLYREDGVTPFYIGIGRGDRWLHHERDAHRNRSHKDRIILRMRAAGVPTVPKAKLREGLSVQEACRIERHLIRAIGRKPNGPLTNRTDGGEGLFNPDNECRQKMREARKHYVTSAETRAKISKSGKGRKCGPVPEDRKKRISSKVRGFRHTPEAIAKIVAAGTGRKWTEEQRRKFIASRSGIPMPDHVKAALLAFHTGRKHPPEEIAKQVAARAGYRHSPETIEKIHAIQANKPETTRAKLADAIRRHWASMTPEDRANRSAAITQGMRTAGKR